MIAMIDFHRELNRLGGLMNLSAGTPAKYFRGDSEGLELTVSPAQVTAEDLGNALPVGMEIFDFYMQKESLGNLFPPQLGDRIETEKGVFKIIGRDGNSNAFAYITSSQNRLVVSTVKERRK